MARPGLAELCLVLGFALGAGCGGKAGGEGGEQDDEGSGATTAPGGPASCTSQQMWVGGDQESSGMHPGAACIACHAQSGEAPSFAIAGTVYVSSHDPSDCLGVDGTTAGVQIVITDANGQTFTLSPNGAGNFFQRGGVALPFHAKVVSGAKERAMGAAQSSGDCNGCHTETGANGAPGRIQAP